MQNRIRAKRQRLVRLQKRSTTLRRGEMTAATLPSKDRRSPPTVATRSDVTPAASTSSPSNSSRLTDASASACALVILSPASRAACVYWPGSVSVDSKCAKYAVSASDPRKRRSRNGTYPGDIEPYVTCTP